MESKLSSVVNCPHCNILIDIIELNCCIFRCGIFKNNFNQINPHESKTNCDAFVVGDLIYGCGKPFIIKIEDDKLIINKCDYI